MAKYFSRLGLALIGIVGFAAAGIALGNDAGVPFSTLYRVTCAGLCLGFIWKLRRDYPDDRWPQVSFWIGLGVNAAIFITPLLDRPASRGEIMLFALPDAMIVLGTRIASYHVSDDHQRATRQMMILGVVVAAISCSILYAVILWRPDNR